MMGHTSFTKVPEEWSRKTLSAPPILANHVDTKHSEATQTAKGLHKFTLEEIQEKSPLRPFSDTWKFPRSIKSCSDMIRSDASPLLQYGEKKGKMYQDWRGVILSETMTPYTMLTNEAHQERLRRITRRKRSEGMLLLLCGKLEKRKQGFKKRGKKPYRKKRAPTSINEKVKRIGPHLEVFEAFTTSRKAPKKDKIASAATCIQKLIRGWLDRTRMRRIRMKAKSHGPTLLAVIKEYRKMMSRIKRRCGILDPTTPLVFDQLEDWLDQKKFYETMFAKREFLKEMDRNDIPKFFRDCGRFPSPDEIDNAMKLVLEDSDSKIININKTQALEMAFLLYPPCGLKLRTAAVAKSTWLKPIIDGEDGYRYLVSGHPALKAADIRIAGALVAASIRERKRKDCEADNTAFLVDSD